MPGVRTLADRLKEQARADADDRDTTSRTDRRKQEQARERQLKTMAVRLVGLKPQQLDRLALDEELRDAIQLAKALGSPKAKNRQIGVVRQHLRQLGPELSAIEAALAAQ